MNEKTVILVRIFDQDPDSSSAKYLDMEKEYRIRNTDRTALKKVQEKVVKMVTGLKGTTYEERWAEPGLETLERRDTQDR
jgi:hypothetical protein